MNYIYIIQIREHLNTNIYKIGKTKQDNLKRFKQYPKGSKFISQYDCFDCDIVERNIITMFKNKYVQRTEYGVEYFEGNLTDMKDDIYGATKENILKNTQTQAIIDWIQDDILLDGKNQYIKFVEEDTGGAFKTPVVLYLNKQKKCEKFTNNFVDQLSIYKFWELCVGQYHNINDKSFIDKLNALKGKLHVKNFDRFVKYYFIDNSIDYTNVISYTSDTYEKLLILFGDNIVNEKFVISEIVYDRLGLGYEDCRYQITCKTTIPNICFVDDMTISLFKCRTNDEYLLGKLFKNNEEVSIKTKSLTLFLRKISN